MCDYAENVEIISKAWIRGALTSGNDLIVSKKHKASVDSQGRANKKTTVWSFPRRTVWWRIRLALIQHPAPSQIRAAHLTHCLTRFCWDKPSPIPTGPIETLNVSLKQFRLEMFTCVLKFSREWSRESKQWKEKRTSYQESGTTHNTSDQVQNIIT